MKTLYTAAAVLAFLVFLICREALKMWRQYQAVKHLPGPPINKLLGFFGLMKTTKCHHRLIADLANTYGGVYSFRALIYRVVILTEPILAARVLKSDKIDKWAFAMNPLSEWLGGHNLLTSPTNAQWRAVRKATAPGFSPAMLRNAAPAVAGIAEKLVESLDDMPEGTSVDVEKLLLLMTLDILGKFAFEQDLQNLQKFHQAVKAGTGSPLSGTLAELLINCTKLVDKNFRSLGWRFRIWRSDVQASWKSYHQWRQVLKQILEADDKQPSSESSVLALLRKAPDVKTGKPISRRRVRAEMAALLFAGSDTTAHQIAWALYLISQHKDVETKLMAELEVLQHNEPGIWSGERSVGYEDIRKLPYLQAVIKETMRLLPSVGVGQRWMVREKLRLSEDLEVLPGMIVSIPHFSIFTNSQNWDRGLEFIPERWSEPGQEFYVPDQLSSITDTSQAADRQKVSHDTDKVQCLPNESGIRAKLGTDSTGRAKRWMPFGDGQRDCAGKELAKIVMPIALATILMKYSFSLAPEMGGPEGVRAAETSTLITGTTNGLYMNIHRRTKPPRPACVN